MTKKILLLPVVLIALLGFTNLTKAESVKLYVSDNKVFYDCPDGVMQAPTDLNIDIKSINIINDRFFKDKNNVYNVSVDSHSRVCLFQKISKIDSETFVFINDYYQKDKNNAYFSTNYWGWGPPEVIKNVDLGSFEVLKEDSEYAMDKNNMYLRGKILSEQAEKISNDTLYENLKGKIILKVESNGEAYYVHPNKQEMHFLSRPVVAFYVMREQGVGITNNDLEKIPVADNYCPSYLPTCDKTEKHNLNFTKQHHGKIFLQVEENGEAWYVNPENNKRYFLGRPTDAFNIMRNLGLGVSDENFNKMEVSNWNTYKNSEYGFEFNYPQNWLYIKEGVNNQICGDRYYYIFAEKNKIEIINKCLDSEECYRYDDSDVVYLNIYNTINELAWCSNKSEKEYNIFTNYLNDHYTNYNKINLNNDVVSYYVIDRGLVDSEVSFIMHNTNVIKLNIATSDLDKENVRNETFDNILKTFKFSE